MVWPAATPVAPLSCLLASEQGVVAPTAHTTTGTSLLVVVPLPSSPLLFEPQATTVPSSSSARAWLLAAEIALTCSRSLAHGAIWPTAQTATGSALAVSVPLPRSPELFEPHAMTVPPSSSARLNSLPPATSLTPLSALLATGTSVFVPSPGLPHSTTPPAFSTARLWMAPAATPLTPSRWLAHGAVWPTAHTATGSSLSFSVPSPTCPSTPRPQAQTAPA